MIEATTRCDGCGRELSLCVCDDRQGAFREAIEAGLASLVVRGAAIGLALIVAGLAAKGCLPW